MSIMGISRNAGTSLQMIDTYYCKRLTEEHSKGTLGQSLNLKEWI